MLLDSDDAARSLGMWMQTKRRGGGLGRWHVAIIAHGCNSHLPSNQHSCLLLS